MHVDQPAAPSLRERFNHPAGTTPTEERRSSPMTRQIVPVLVALGAVAVASACGNQTPTQPSTIRSAPSLAPSAEMPARTTAARNSEQLEFSGTTDNGLIGFWIWCEVDSGNPYQDECNGAMYFYALGLTKHVEDVENGIVPGPEETYQIRVHSTTDDSVACTLQNTAEPVKGPHNTVTVSCSPPSVNGVSSSAVVNVTGPGD
jgi:hypothetical protein